MNEFTNSKRQLTEADLKEFEEELSVKLPAEVKAQYFLYNGGEPQNYLFVQDGTNVCDAGIFPYKVRSTR